MRLALQALNIRTCDNAAAWCRKMGLRLDTGLAPEQVLEEEKVRLRLRDDLQVAAAAKDDVRFREVVFDALLSRPAVSQRLFSRWQFTLSPHIFHVQAARGGVRTHGRGFGFERNRKGHYFAEAVAVQELPLRWEHYTGRPVFLHPSSALLLRRLQSVARGGYGALSEAEQRSLRYLEGEQDAWYRVVALHRGPHAPRQLGMLLRPPHVPSVSVWQDLMDLCPDDLNSIRTKVEEERSYFGISFEDENWVVDAERLLPAVEQSLSEFHLKPKVCRDIEAYLAFMREDPAHRPPRVIMRGDERAGWEDEKRRREHEVSNRGQAAAVLVAKVIIRAWFERTPKDWVELLWSSSQKLSRRKPPVPTLPLSLRQDDEAVCCDAGFEGLDNQLIVDGLVDVLDDPVDAEEDIPARGGLLGGAFFSA